MEQAVQVAFDTHASHDLKVQALDFLNRLRSEPQGWQVCLFLAFRESRPPEVVRHVALDVVNNVIQSQQLGEADLSVIRDNISTHLQRTYGGARSGSVEADPLTIENKITQTLTYLFMSMYPSLWTSFFHDILALTSNPSSPYKDNIPGIKIYLRILISVHEEIGDMLIARTTEEQRRDNDLKDLVRARDVQVIAASWHEILSQWRSRNDLIVDLCLTGMGRWVVWIDISLVVREELLSLLFDCLTHHPLSDSDTNLQMQRLKALETFSDLLSKKMGPGDKLELIEILKIERAVSLCVNSPSLTELRSSSEYDTDFAEEVGKLVNNTVSDIVRALEGANDKDQLSQRSITQLRSFLPYIIRFLSDEYDEICASVIPCLTDLLTVMRKKAKANSNFLAENSDMLPLILDAVIMKMKYDETSSWGNEDAQTDEAEFQDLRRRLHVLQQAVSAVDESVYISKITNVVLSAFESYHSQNGSVGWRDIDLALYEMFLFGELGLKNGGLYSKTRPASPASERLIEMMFKLVQSGKQIYP